ncbi:MAG: outer membrane beta-barrel protein [Bacteroidota bacterium]
MKKLLAVAIIFAATFGIAKAQENKPHTASGNKTLLFSINGFGDFGVGGSYAGSVPLGNSTVDSMFRALGELVGTSLIRPVYGFGMRFFVADNVGLRIALGFNSTSNSTPRVTGTTTTTDKDSRMAFGISPGLEFHVAHAGPVSFYTGGVLSYAMSMTSKGQDSTETSATQSAFSINGLVGAEFYPWENVSLGAEYQVGVRFASTSSKAKGTSTDGPSSTDIGIAGPIRVALGIGF